MDDAPDYSWLPEILAEIAGVVGLDATFRIAQLRGGARAYFPAEMTEAHWLVDCIGYDLAHKLCRHFRTKVGIELLIPKGADAIRRRRYYELRAAGHSVENAARLCGGHVRSARRWEKNKTALIGARARVKRLASPQIDLLDWLERTG